MPLFFPQATPWSLEHSANGGIINGGNGVLVANTTYLVGVNVPVGVVVTNMRTRHSGVSAGNLDMGIYDSAGNRIDHTGVTAVSAINTVQSIALSGGNLPLSPGRYYLALWVDNSTDTYYRESTGTTNQAWGNFLSGVSTNAGGLLATFAAMGGTTAAASFVGIMATIAGGMA